MRNTGRLVSLYYDTGDAGYSFESTRTNDRILVVLMSKVPEILVKVTACQTKPTCIGILSHVHHVIEEYIKLCSQNHGGSITRIRYTGVRGPFETMPDGVHFLEALEEVVVMGKETNQAIDYATKACPYPVKPGDWADGTLACSIGCIRMGLCFCETFIDNLVAGIFAGISPWDYKYSPDALMGILSKKGLRSYCVKARTGGYYCFIEQGRTKIRLHVKAGVKLDAVLRKASQDAVDTIVSTLKSVILVSPF